jgi:AcrR family transcriptional regulator
VAKGEETRCIILRQGLALASLVGLEGITIGSLAQEIGMSKSGLFAHFRSKDNLQLALLQTAAERFVETVIAPALHAPRGEPRLRSLFHYWMEWDDADFQPGGCVFVRAAIELGDQTGPVRDRLMQTQRDWLDTLAAAVRIGVDEGHFRDDLDPTQIASDIYAVAIGYHFISRFLHDPEARPRALISLDRIIEDARG